MRKVVVTSFAKENLRDIYDYYKITASLKVAQRIKQQIIATIKNLKTREIDWQKEEFLHSLNKNHRRSVVGNYKIIYYEENSIVYITDIFDSRQSPEKEKG